jgi:hypothetical protein
LSAFMGAQFQPGLKSHSRDHLKNQVLQMKHLHNASEAHRPFPDLDILTRSMSGNPEIESNTPAFTGSRRPPSMRTNGEGLTTMCTGQGTRWLPQRTPLPAHRMPRPAQNARSTVQPP